MNDKLNAIIRATIEDDKDQLRTWISTAAELIEKHMDSDGESVYLDRESLVEDLEAQLTAAVVENAEEMFYWLLAEDEDPTEVNEVLGYAVNPMHIGMAKIFTEVARELNWREFAEALLQWAEEEVKRDGPCCNDFSCPCGGQALYGR